MNNKESSRNIGRLILLISVICLMAGCGVTKIVGSAAKLGMESDELDKMALEDVEKLVSPEIDLEAIRTSLDNAAGKYVRIEGVIDTEGSKDFPLQMEEDKHGDSAVFILEETAFVISLVEVPGLKNGDYVELIGRVSESRLLKATRDMYPDENIPDLVTVIAKKVTIIERDLMPIDDASLDNTSANEGIDENTDVNSEPPEGLDDPDGDGIPG